MITCENIYKFREYTNDIDINPLINNIKNIFLNGYIDSVDSNDNRKIIISIKDKKDTDYVIDNILKEIKSYYLDNYYGSKVPLEEAEDFVNYLSNPKLYVDVYNIDTVLEFQL